MAIYRIERNNQFNSNEVYFDGKPSEQVREALKGLRMRWHGIKRCWYGFAENETIVAAINGATPSAETGGTLSEGYLGATRWDGVKSHKHLYGADLSAAIRADLKTAGIKGASVRCHSYSGGQSITVTVKLADSDYLTEAEYVDGYRIKGGWHWIPLSKNEHVTADDYFAAETAAAQEEIRIRAARYEYEIAKTDCQQCHSADSAKAVTSAARARLCTVQSIIEAYRYDDSNSMVDYFDTNFYWTMHLVHA